MARNYQVIIDNLLVQLFVIFTSEWKAAAEEGEQEDTRGIYISVRTTKLNFLYDLRCHVRGCATEELDFLCVGNLGTESKVN